MKAAILAVGTEILFGQIVNTNTVFLSRELNNLGIDVMYHYTVGDNAGRLSELIEDIFKDCDLIITTGGLGPTQDDITKETVADVMGDELVFNREAMDNIDKAFKLFGSNVTKNNEKQAWLPKHATVFQNRHGTAPGFALEMNGKCAICLPGPPREMKGLFKDCAHDYLAKKSDGKVIFYRLIRTIGLGESQMETDLMDLIDNQTDPTVATYAKEGESYLRIASKRETKEEAEVAVNEMLAKVKERIGDYIYSCDDEELKDVTCKLLLKKRISISCAESCTGGLFAKELTDYPGISEIFDRGIVTYSNNAKVDELGVSEETLAKFGAVSENTAGEMAAGLQAKSGSDLCISVTGIAGPGGCSNEKPVGLVYIGLAYKGEVTAIKKQYRRAGREWIRSRAVLSMFEAIYDLLKKDA